MPQPPMTAMPPPPSAHAGPGAPDAVVLQSYEDYLRWLDQVLGAESAGGAGHGSAAGDGVRSAGGGAGPGGTADDAAGSAKAGGSPFAAIHVPREPGQRFRAFDAAPEMLVLPTGTVLMGAHPADPDAEANERPRRQIQITRPIAMGLTPVTFEQWDACLAHDGTRHRPGDATWGRANRPVMNVSWHDAEEYCGWLGRRTGLRWRLPSEAEWEFACWAGQPPTDRFPWGMDLGFRQLRHHAWFSQNSDLRTQPVGQLQPNAWGLLDMLGNVAEWVADAYHPSLEDVPADGRAFTGNPGHGSRVIKGGSWLESARTVRPSVRDHFHPDHRSYRVGFRVVVES